MERLTSTRPWSDAQNDLSNEPGYGYIWQKLQRYEETGLEPEEIMEAVKLFSGTNVDVPKEIIGWVKRATWHCKRLAELTRLVSFDRLRELAQAYRLLGNTVYEPNKRGVISTYKVISVHFSGSSILVGWDLLDGIYSNLNGFEISALGKTVFLTREAAEAALQNTLYKNDADNADLEGYKI